MKTQYLSLFFNIVRFLSLHQYFNKEQMLKINYCKITLIHMFSIYALTSIKRCGNLKTDKGTAYRKEAQE